jgi:hypothetical protein
LCEKESDDGGKDGEDQEDGIAEARHGVQKFKKCGTPNILYDVKVVIR